jgi:hypothetical protein
MNSIQYGVLADRAALMGRVFHELAVSVPMALVAMRFAGALALSE